MNTNQKLFVYIYPCKFNFLFGANFGYIPRIDIKNIEIDQLLSTFVNILERSQAENLEYLKFGFNLYSENEADQISKINNFLNRLSDFGFQIKKSPPIQFLKSYQLNLVTKNLLNKSLIKTNSLAISESGPDYFDSGEDNPKNVSSEDNDLKHDVSGSDNLSTTTKNNNSKNYKIDFEIDTLEDFYNQNKDFWKSCNEKVNRYTKKILKTAKNGDILILSQKNKQLWDSFYKLHTQTTYRQNFHTQPKTYLKELFGQEFSLVYTIFIKQGQTWEPASTFLGIISPDNSSLTYLIGGNSEFGMTSRVQYLTQLLAIKFCYDNEIPIYDMGGYQENTGYGQFKESYKGEVAVAQGVYTIALKPFSLDLFLEQIKLNGIKGLKSSLSK